MLPSGYFVSTGSCFQRCPNWLFRLFWRIPIYLCSLRAPQSPLRLFSRDFTAWLFRLCWILFPERSQLVISSLLEDSNLFVLSSCTTVSLVDFSPEMLPPGYFVSTGSCFQRCPNWLFRLFWRWLFLFHQSSHVVSWSSVKLRLYNSKRNCRKRNLVDYCLNELLPNRFEEKQPWLC